MPRLLVFLFASALLAQYPPYPGGYPGGGQYPGGMGIPFPRRTKKTTTDQKKPDQPLPNFAGKLQRIDSKTIVVELDDNRVLEFRRTGKTAFVNVKESALKAGDHISVEATQDVEGYLTAVNVHLEAAASTTGGAQQQSAGPQSSPAAGDKTAPAPQTAATPGDDDSAKTVEERDPDRPVLRRGAPRRKAASTARPEPEPEAAQAETASAKPPEPTRAMPAAEATPAGDPVIEKARAAAAAFSETLPDYVVQEFMSRYASETRTPDWRALDVVSSDVVYENGKENYRNLKINGKPVKEGMEQMTGAWSTGEFGTMLLDLLSPMTAARFRFRKASTISGRDAVVYDYTVDRENSHWTVKMASQSVEPAYKGAVWIDKETARILRIEMEAVDLPEAFPLDHVESAADYGFVRLGTTAQFLLPVHAETLSCQRGSYQCSQNKIDFRNYHKYTGESTITFGN